MHPSTLWHGRPDRVPHRRNGGATPVLERIQSRPPPNADVSFRTDDSRYGREGLETNDMFLEFILPNLILGWVGIGFVVSLIASLFV